MSNTKTPIPGKEYILNLYVTGMSPGSIKAIENLKSICEQYIPGKYSLEITDILKFPETMYENDLIASPTLIKRAPLPVKKLIGDLSNRERVLKILSIDTQKV
jgi:circadian clock protein KaiB